MACLQHEHQHTKCAHSNYTIDRRARAHTPSMPAQPAMRTHYTQAHATVRVHQMQRITITKTSNGIAVV